MPGKVMMCSMCRCDATEEHLNSDWHKYNVTCTSQGKTPMAKDLYENFEKMRIAGGGAAAAPAPTTAKPANTKNVNQWHWEEKNIADWAHNRLAEVLKEAVIPVQGNGQIKITNVKEVVGDAYLNLRKGKVRLGFELKCKMEWEGVINDADGKEVVKCTGKAVLLDLDDSMDEDEYEDQIEHISVDKEAQGTDAILTVMKKLGRKTLADQLNVMVKELHAMKTKREEL